MSSQPLAIVIRTAGTNCDREMCRAFAMAGARVDLIHLDRLIRQPPLLDDADLIGFPGGFSYGDDVAAGRVKAVKCRVGLWSALKAAAERGVCMMGACNGFQVMTQIGLLPGFEPGAWPDAPPEPVVALADNLQDRFVDRWTRIETAAASPCIWTNGLSGDDDVMMLPIAHGEGRFVSAYSGLVDELRRTGRIAVAYASDDNPNGSEGNVAGICDPSGRIIGLMPHPERYLEWAHHPYATRLSNAQRSGDPPGLRMFRNAVEYVRTGVGVQ
jgi:phosphoribosylformylglycinamidine synthase I